MSATPLPARIGRLCEHYGPGRLPGAQDRSIGAGYAFATAALAASLLFIVVIGAQQLSVVGVDALASPAEGGLVYFGLLAVPFVVPTAFFAGAVAWRLVPEAWSYHGPLTGLVATLLTYVGATALVGAYALATMVLEPATLVDPLGAVVIAVLFGGFGFVYTSWLALPLGAVSGWIHERAVAAE